MPKILRMTYPNTGQFNSGSGKGLFDTLTQPHHLIDNAIEM